MLKQTTSKFVLAGFALALSVSGATLANTTGKLFVAGDGSGNIAVIDAHTNTYVDNINIGTGTQPHNLAVGPNNQYLWATLKGTGEVAKIRVQDNTLITKYSTGGASPVHLTVSPDGSSLYIVNQGSDQIVRMDTATGVLDGTSYTFGGSPSPSYKPHAINVGPDGKVWVTDQTQGNVTLLDSSLSGVFTTLNVGLAAGAEPVQVVFSVDGSQAFTTNVAENTVSVITVGDGVDTGTYSVDTSFLMSTSGLMGPMGLVVDPDGTKLWTSGTAGSTVHAHSLQAGDNYSYTETPGLLAAHGLDINDGGSRLYTSVRFDTNSVGRDAIAVIDAATGAVVTTIQTTGQIGLDNASGLHGLLYVAPVPVPAAVWLFGSGLLVLLSRVRRQRFHG